MNIDLAWKERCEHCEGYGECDTTSYRDCAYGCKPIVTTTWNKKKTKSKTKTSAGQCLQCKGTGWLLTELGKSFFDFMQWYYNDYLLTQISDIADNRIYQDKKVD